MTELKAISTIDLHKLHLQLLHLRAAEAQLAAAEHYRLRRPGPRRYQEVTDAAAELADRMVTVQLACTLCGGPGYHRVRVGHETTPLASVCAECDGRTEVVLVDG